MNRSLQIPVYIGRTTGVLSIAGSSLIIFMILSDKERKLTRPYHRIMLAMSVIDVLQSLSLVVSVTAFPRQSGIYGAKGNGLTCEIQGFFLVLGLAVRFYNSFLHIYYLLTIRYKLSSKEFFKWECVFHAISISLPLTVGIILSCYDGMTPRATMCFPRGRIFLWIRLLSFPTAFLICIVSMMSICWTITSQTRKTKKYTNFSTSNKSPARRSRTDYDRDETVKQACLYTFIFLLTYTFPFVGDLYTRDMEEVDPPYSLILLSAIFFPLQGFWNFVVYIRPGVQRLMKFNPEKSHLEAVGDVIFKPNSISRTNCRLSGQSLEPKQLPPSKIIVETVCKSQMANSIILDTSKEDCVNSKSTETTCCKDQDDLLIIKNPPLLENSHVDNHTRYLTKIGSQNTVFSKIATLEDGIGEQPIAWYKRDLTRRSSLISIASILDGQDSTFDDSDSDAGDNM